MLVRTYTNLPLYNAPDYQYTSQIGNVSYTFHYQWNERMQQWIFDIFDTIGNPLILGEALVPDYVLLADYVVDPQGVMYLQPIGDTKNETIENPYEIWQYYDLFFIQSEDDGT